MSAKVLLFEIEPDLCILVSDWLGAHGFCVVETYSLEHAESLVDSEGIDLFLSDSGCPDVELVMENYRIYGRKIGKRVPMVLFTAHPITRAEAMELGCIDVIHKPFDLYELLHRVRAYPRQS